MKVLWLEFPISLMGGGVRPPKRVHRDRAEIHRLGPVRAWDSSEMGPASGKLATWSYCLSMWKTINSNKKLMDLIEDTVCQCWQWNVNGDVSGISWARAGQTSKSRPAISELFKFKKEVLLQLCLKNKISIGSSRRMLFTSSVTKCFPTEKWILPHQERENVFWLWTFSE